MTTRDAYTCPSCAARGTVRLEPGSTCPSCTAAAAWARYADTRLVIDSDEIARAVARREGERPGVGRWLRPALALLLALALAAAGMAALLRVFAARGASPLAEIFGGLRADSRAATLLGAGALVWALLILRRMRRHRHHRSLPLLVGHSAAVVAGTIAAIAGGFLWRTNADLGFRHLAMPPAAAIALGTSLASPIVAATAVIVAPDGDGDFRWPSVGSGAVIHAEAGRAWIVTCKHVAMPYVSPSSWSDERQAHPLWVELADGRSAPGRVRWTARPPIDVALVELEVADPPDPVRIAGDSSSAQLATSVLFVPNPLRRGWAVHHGAVVKRESHRTPAGEYSLLFTDLPVQPGDSGSGLFDSTGALIGLNTWAGRDESGPRGISLPAEVMRGMLDVIRDQTMNGGAR